MGHIRKKNKRIPNSSKWFSIIVIKGPPLYNKQGKKISHRVGNYMKYADITKEYNIEIDINYYLGKMMGIYA